MIDPLRGKEQTEPAAALGLTSRALFYFSPLRIPSIAVCTRSRVAVVEREASFEATL
jgi:hypothetical protein